MADEKQKTVENKGREKNLFPFTSEHIRDKIEWEEPTEDPANLDNFDNANDAYQSVQMTREIIAPNGCRVKLVFPENGRKGVRREIAGMLLATIPDMEE